MQVQTKSSLTKDQIGKVVKTVFQTSDYISTPLSGGLFNQIYLIEVLGKKCILKVAPTENIDVLHYEKNIIQNEIYVYQQYENHVPFIPKLLFSDTSKELIPFDYLITEYIDGTSLVELWGTNNLEVIRNQVYPKLMKTMAYMHRVKSETYGYYNQRSHKSYQEVILKMFQDLLQDAKRKDVLLPYSPDKIIDLVHGMLHIIDMKGKGSVLHFDLWDGNLLIEENNLMGIIDLERSFTGDPIADFVPLHFDIFDPSNRHYVDTYNKYAEHPIILNQKTRGKYLFYKLYLRLIMVIECEYRDVNGSFDEQYKWASNELIQVYNELERFSL